MLQVMDGSGPGAGDGMLEQSVGTLPVVDDARWSAALTSDSWGALLVWMVLLVVLQAALWPLARRLFRRFPDHGWGLTRSLALVLAAYPVWLFASLELIRFRAAWAAASLVFLIVVAWTIRVRGRHDPVAHPSWFRTPAVLGAEAVFWGVFLLFLFYRLLNPDSWHPAWGGEKPMEFAHINAILRSAHFPPHDPWYADGALNYYYYGMYLVAFMMKLTGIPSEIAFNLAQPTLIALLAAGAWSVSAALASRINATTRTVLLGGALGVLLVNVAGNLVVAARLFSGIGAEPEPRNDFVYWVWNPREIVPRTINEFPYFTALYADLHAHVVALPITVVVIGLCLAVVLDARSTTLALTRPLANRTLTAMTSAQLLLVALALGTLFMTNAWDVPVYGALVFTTLLLATRPLRTWWRRIAGAAAVAVLVGGVAYALALPFTTNFLTRYGEIGTVDDPSPLVSVQAHFGVFLLIVTFGLSLIAATLWRNPPALAQPRVVATAIGAALVVRWLLADAAGDTLLLVDGITVGLVSGWLLFAVVLAQPRRIDFGLPQGAVHALAAAAWITVIGALVMERLAFGLFLGMGLAAGLLWLLDDDPGRRFGLALVAAALFVAAGVEVVYLVDDLGGGDWYRMNTVFKFYNAVWVLAALGSAALVVRMIDALGRRSPAPVSGSGKASPPLDQFTPSLGPDHDPDLRSEAQPAPAPLPSALAQEGTSGPPEVREPASHSHGWTRAWAATGLVVTALALVSALAYPLVATPIRLEQRFPQDGRSWTLNAFDWMAYGELAREGVTLGYAEDRAVIEWFNEEVAGTPVIAEATLGAYMCAGSRISVHTGLPTIVGWTWHQTQQRGPADLAAREADQRRLFASTDPEEKREILDRYGVGYVVVGQLERVYPSPDCTPSDNAAGVDAFAPLVGTVLEEAFRSGDTVVYRVVR